MNLSTSASFDLREPGLGRGDDRDFTCRHRRGQNAQVHDQEAPCSAGQHEWLETKSAAHGRSFPIDCRWHIDIGLRRRFECHASVCIGEPLAASSLMVPWSWFANSAALASHMEVPSEARDRIVRGDRPTRLRGNGNRAGRPAHEEGRPATTSRWQPSRVSCCTIARRRSMTRRPHSARAGAFLITMSRFRETGTIPIKKK